MQNQAGANGETPTASDEKSWWERWIDIKTIISGLAGGLLLAGIGGVYLLFSESTENRVVNKLRVSKDFSETISAKILSGDTLANTIVTKLRESDEIKNIKSIGEDVGKIRERLASIDEKIKSLEREVFEKKYAPRTIAAGIRNPEFRNVSLQPNEHFSSIIQTRKNIELSLNFTIIKVTPKTIFIRMDGGSKTQRIIIENFIIEVPAEPGKFYNLSAAFQFVGAPKILIGIVDRPTPETAIVATGASDAMSPTS